MQLLICQKLAFNFEFALKDLPVYLGLGILRATGEIFLYLFDTKYAIFECLTWNSNLFKGLYINAVKWINYLGLNYTIYYLNAARLATLKIIAVIFLIFVIAVENFVALPFGKSNVCVENEKMVSLEKLFSLSTLIFH